MALIVICGGSATGKDTLQNIISKKYNISICVSSTTRPMRENEINHITYHFISEKQFKDDLDNDKFIEHRIYNTAYGVWYYGTPKKSINLKINQLAILEQTGFYNVKSLVGEENVIGIYISTPERIKIDRALSRETRTDKEFYREFYRRMGDDLYMFEKVESDSRVYKVENINLNDCVKQIEEILINNKII